MFANLMAYDNLSKKTTVKSVELSDDQNNIIHVTIGLYKYQFNSNGELKCVNDVQSCNTLSIKVSCAQPPSKNVCYPVINSKSE